MTTKQQNLDSLALPAVLKNLNKILHFQNMSGDGGSLLAQLVEEADVVDVELKFSGDEE